MSSVYSDLGIKLCLKSYDLPKVFDLTTKKFLPYYADVILAVFALLVPGVYGIESKDNRAKRISIRFVCNDRKCGKRYKIHCQKEDIREGEDLNWAVTSDSKVCEHKGEAPRSRNITGEKREDLKKKLKVKSVGEVYRSAIKDEDKSVVLKGITNVPNRNTIKKIRQEMLGAGDLDADPIFDVVRRAEKDETGFINLSLSPFRCTLVSNQQIITATNYAKRNVNMLRRFHFDATGSMLKKNAQENPEMMLYFLIFPIKTNPNNKQHLRFNMAEFISESQSSFAIEIFLRNVKNSIEKLNGTSFQLVHEVVVDWSWAEMNAVIRAFNNMTVKEYLQKCFDKIIGVDDCMEGFVTLLECSSHLTKTMLSDVKKFLQTYEKQKIICRMLGKLFDSTTWEDAKSTVYSLIQVLLTPNETLSVLACLKTFEEYDFQWMKLENHVVLTDEIHFKKEDVKEIYKDSSFYQVR